MTTAQFQVYTVQRFPTADAARQTFEGNELLIELQDNQKYGVFNVADGKKILESIHQTYCGHRIRNGKHKELASYAGRKFVWMEPVENGVDLYTEIPFFKVRKPVKPVRIADFVTVEVIAPYIEPVQEIVEIAAEDIAVVPEEIVVQAEEENVDAAVIACPECGSVHHKKNGKHKKTGKQQYRCKECNKNF
jgi:predicted RNA-binding Zn-ribbon protein involved in translation (DUF1610 family)